MSKYIGDNIGYFVARKRGEEPNELEQLLKIDDWDGSVFWVEEFETAKKFETLQEAKTAIDIQKQIMILTNPKSNSEFKVLKKSEKVEEIV
mgnify:CR=1 FL=1